VAVESDVEVESDPEPEPKVGESPKVELTADEKAQSFIQHDSTDLTEYVMNTSFVNFSLPGPDEGFESVKYTWFKKDKAPDHVKNWILEKKLTTRVEDITPSKWFRDKHTAWQALMQGWKVKQNEYKGMLARKTAEKASKAASKAAADKRAQTLAALRAKQAEKDKEEGKEEESAEAEKKDEEENGAKEMEVEEEPEEEKEVDFATVDVFGVPDIRDLGGHMPLFKEFGFEDWAMATLRFEIHLLAHAFCKDCNDPDRTGIHLDHLNFYYQKYYNKSLSFKAYGVENANELLDMIDDTIWVTKSIVETQIPAELESTTIFIRLAEEARRYRGLMLELGEESAKLKIVKPGEGLLIQGMQQGMGLMAGMQQGMQAAWAGRAAAAAQQANWQSSSQEGGESWGAGDWTQKQSWGSSQNW